MANKQYESGYKSFAPTDVHEVDMDRRADWNETDELDPSYILNKPNVVSAETQADWNEDDNTKTAFIKNKPTIPAIPSAPAAGESDAMYVLKVSSGGSVTWEAYTPTEG